MLAVIIEDEYSRLVRLEEGQQKVSLAGTEVTLMITSGTITVNEGSGISVSLLSKGSGIWRLCRKDQACHLILIREDRGWDRFSSYSMKDVITIGSGREDDIFLDDSRIRPQQVIIDCTGRKVHDTHETGLLSDNGRITHKTSLIPRHVYSFLGVRIVTDGRIIAVNRLENLKVRLVPFKPEKLKRKAENKRMFSCVLPPMEQKEKRFFEPLEEPAQLPQDNIPPLLFTIGPSLTMSSASMISALINVRNSLDAGREISEILPVMILPAAMMLSTLLWIPGQRLYVRLDRKSRIRKRINSYLEYLTDLEERILLFERWWGETAAARWPAEFQPLIPWQKEYDDPDLYTVRGGCGEVIFDIDLPRQFRLRSNDVLYRKLEELPARLCRAADMPVLLDLNQYRDLIFCGGDEYWLVLFLQLIHSVSPKILKVFFYCTEEWEQDHFWIRLLPHCRYQSERFIIHLSGSRSYAGIENDYQILCIIQDPEQSGKVMFSDAMIWYIGNEGSHKGGETVISADAGLVRIKNGKECQAFSSDIRLPEDLFAYMYSLQRECSVRHERQTGCTFFDLLGITHPGQLDIAGSWRESSRSSTMQGYLGFDAKGERIMLDLHESGMGPYGLVAGMTGSGKSELLISFLLSLAVRYSPQDISFILIDFKGGGTIQSLTDGGIMIPHIAGILTDLEENDIRRVLVSFGNECKRRERLLQEASSVHGCPIMNIDSYRSCWNEECSLPYLPHLVILADEFAQMKKSNPEFLSELISIARIGRSLGIHLILATQKPSGVIDEQIWSNCRFRICLKVQDRQDSSEVLHSPEAVDLRRPGDFILQYDRHSRTGRGGYAGCSIYEQTADSGIIDSNGDLVSAAVRHPANRVTQASAIVRELIRTGEMTGIRAKKIWLDLPERPGPGEAEMTAGMMIGRADDYENGTQPYLYISLRQPGIIVVSPSRQQKHDLIRAFFYQLVRSRPEDEVCLLDENEISSGWIRECTQIILRGSAADDELWSGMIRYIRQRNDRSRIIWIIMTDYPAMKEAGEEKSGILHQIMESAEKLNIRFVICGTSAAVFYYRHLSLFHERYCLKNSNRADISQLFETSAAPACEKEGYGLYGGSRILSFAMLAVSDEDVLSICRAFRRKSTAVIPVMPVSLSLADCHQEGLPAGMYYETCDWCIVPEGKILLFLATYYRELEGLIKAYRQAGRKIRINDPGDPADEVIFMTLDRWTHSSLPGNTENIFLVYVGTGFHDQYQFTARRKKALRPNEGIVLYEGRNEVIRIAEPAETAADHILSGSDREIL